MKPSRKPSKDSGVVLVDFLTASTYLIVLATAVISLVMHLWAYNFLNIESYYLARSRLYGNTQACESANSLISQKWIKRYRYCYGSNVYTHYELLPDHLPQIGSFSLHLER